MCTPESQPANCGFFSGGLPKIPPTRQVLFLKRGVAIPRELTQQRNSTTFETERVPFLLLLLLGQKEKQGPARGELGVGRLRHFPHSWIVS